MTCEAITINGRNVISKLIFPSSFRPYLRLYLPTTKGKKKNTKTDRNSNTSLFPSTRAVKGCFNHKQKVKSNVHIA